MKSPLGYNIAQIRKQQGFTQDHLAAYLNVSRVQISHYESGKRNISVTELNKLADLFGVEISDLLEDELDLQNLNFAFAYRCDNNQQDLNQIAAFKKIVLNYIKMERIDAD